MSEQPESGRRFDAAFGLGFVVALWSAAAMMVALAVVVVMLAVQTAVHVFADAAQVLS